MILKASQRGGGQDLAAHLMKMEDNEHVDLHELRGFATDTLKGALKEAEAVSRGTQCRQYLFSLSLSPPEQASVAPDVFERAIDRIEERLGLEGQPRAIVFHEKDGRRHAHCVWSRICAQLFGDSECASDLAVADVKSLPSTTDAETQSNGTGAGKGRNRNE